jgi:O-antigen ligase
MIENKWSSQCMSRHLFIISVIGILAMLLIVGIYYTSPILIFGVIIFLFVTLCLLKRPVIGIYFALVYISLFHFVTTNILFPEYPIVSGFKDFIILMVFGLWFVRRIVDQKLTYRKGDMMLPLYLFIFYSVISLIHTPDFVSGLDEIRTMFIFMLLSIVIGDTVRTTEELKFLMKVFLFTGILVSLIGILQKYFFPQMALAGIYESGHSIAYAQVTSTFGHVSNLSPYLVILLIFISTRILFSRHQSNFIHYSTLFLVLIALIFTYSRKAWLIASVLLPLIFIKKDKRYILLFVIVGTILPFIIDQVIYERILSIFSLDHPSNAARLEELDAFAMMIEHNWLIGLGAGAIVPFGQGESYSEFYTHNNLLKIMANYGIIGLFLYLCFIVTIIYKGYQLYVQLTDFYLKSVILGVTLSMLALFSLSPFALVFEIFPVNFYFWFIFGCMLSIKNIAMKDRQVSLE